MPCCCAETEHLVSNSAVWLEYKNLQIFDRCRDEFGNPASSYTDRLVLNSWMNEYAAPLTFGGLCVAGNFAKYYLSGSPEPDADVVDADPSYALRLAQDENNYLITDTVASRTECTFDDYTEESVGWWTRLHQDGGVDYGPKAWADRDDWPVANTHCVHYWHPDGYVVAYGRGNSTAFGVYDETYTYTHDGIDATQTASGIYNAQDFYWGNGTTTWTITAHNQYQFKKPLTFGPADVDVPIYADRSFTITDKIFFGDEYNGTETVLPHPFNSTGNMEDEDKFPDRRLTPLQQTDDFMKWRCQQTRHTITRYKLTLFSNDITPDRFSTYADFTQADVGLCYRYQSSYGNLWTTFGFNYALRPHRDWDSAVDVGDDTFYTDITTFDNIGQEWLIRFVKNDIGLYGDYGDGISETVYGWVLLDTTEEAVIAAARFPQAITLNRYGYYNLDAEVLTFDLGIYFLRL